MSSESTPHAEADAPVRSQHELLITLDLATEVLEGLTELGVETRDEVEALMEQLEWQIVDPC